MVFIRITSQKLIIIIFIMMTPYNLASIPGREEKGGLVYLVGACAK